MEEMEEENRTWVALPDPPRLKKRDVDLVATADDLHDPDEYETAYHRRDAYEILAYAVHDSTIIISMLMGVYIFDVNSQDAGWKKVTTYEDDRFPFKIGGAAHYVDGMCYAMESGLLRAYDFNKDGAVINDVDVPGFIDSDLPVFDLVRFHEITRFYSIGRRTLALVTTGKDRDPPYGCSCWRRTKEDEPYRECPYCAPGRHHVILQLRTLSKPHQHYLLPFSMEGSIHKWAYVAACFLMPN